MRGGSAGEFKSLGRDILHILNETDELKDSLERVIAEVKARTGFDAVGIRLSDGEDYPYIAQKGLSPQFLAAENSLLERGANGGVCRGKDGKPRLSCTCGMVLMARAGERNPFLTPGGSFWTNDAAPLLKLPPGKDPRVKPRNRCIHDGYRSVALVPIRNKDEIVGLLHLNDRRKRRFSREKVQLLEGLATSIGTGLARKRLEADLRESEAKYRGVFESGFDPVFVIDARSMRVDSVNAAALRLYGYAERELLGLEAAALSAVPAASRAAVSAVSEGRIRGRIEGIRHRKKDGTEFPVEISASRCVIGGEPKVIATVHDLTRRLRDAQAATKAAAEASLLKERDRLSKELMATVSHELRTPLAAIQGYAETLRCGGLEDSRNRLGFVTTIEKHAQRLAYLVEDLLLLSDLDTRAKEPEFAAVDLASFVDECLKGLAPLVKKEGTKLSVDVPPGLAVRADADRLTRVFQNLLDNAFKYNRPGGGIRVTARAEGSEAFVTIGDSGRGIPAGELALIFGRFYRSPRTKHIQGTGLGLSIVKAIVELHGGRIWAESVVGKGSDFRFTLPLAG
ncbi:MAG: ATP-binding protein [Elusimicrobiota bacterium]|nr:ATP-binding protein [Elusimicrobiota bacterium]